MSPKPGKSSPWLIGNLPDYAQAGFSFENPKDIRTSLTVFV